MNEGRVATQPEAPPMALPSLGEVITAHHPLDSYIRADRFPHIWCPGCGLGIILTAFVRAMLASGIPPEKHVCVSGIGCTGRIAGYLNLDSFHTTHGRAIPFATGLHLVRPDLEVTVISGDGDLFAIGGNHFIHAARRNLDINVICVNNFKYGMTGGQLGPTTPPGAFSTTSPYGNYEPPFNLPPASSGSRGGVRGPLDGATRPSVGAGHPASHEEEGIHVHRGPPSKKEPCFQRR